MLLDAVLKSFVDIVTPTKLEEVILFQPQAKITLKHLNANP